MNAVIPSRWNQPQHQWTASAARYTFGSSSYTTSPSSGPPGTHVSETGSSSFTYPYLHHLYRCGSTPHTLAAGSAPERPHFPSCFPSASCPFPSPLSSSPSSPSAPSSSVDLGRRSPWLSPPWHPAFAGSSGTQMCFRCCVHGVLSPPPYSAVTTSMNTEYLHWSRPCPT